MTNLPTDIPILDDDAVARLEAVMTGGDSQAMYEAASVDNVRALCATVKQLRARQEALEQALRPLWAISVPSGTPEPENMEQLISDLKQLPRSPNAALQSELEQLRAENEQLKQECKALSVALKKELETPLR